MSNQQLPVATDSNTSDQPDHPDYLNYSEAGYCDITLPRPMQISGVEQTTIRMREPTVEDQIIASEIKGSDAHKEVTMFANLCEISPDDVRRMPMKAYRRLQEAYHDFLD